MICLFSSCHGYVQVCRKKIKLFVQQFSQHYRAGSPSVFILPVSQLNRYMLMTFFNSRQKQIALQSDCFLYILFKQQLLATAFCIIRFFDPSVHYRLESGWKIVQLISLCTCSMNGGPKRYFSAYCGEGYVLLVFNLFSYI